MRAGWGRGRRDWNTRNRRALQTGRRSRDSGAEGGGSTVTSPLDRPGCLGHGSLETFGGPQRHAIAHRKAEKIVIPNMSSVMLGKSVLF